MFEIQIQSLGLKPSNPAWLNYLRTIEPKVLSAITSLKTNSREPLDAIETFFNSFQAELSKRIQQEGQSRNGEILKKLKLEIDNQLSALNTAEQQRQRQLDRKNINPDIR